MSILLTESARQAAHVLLDTVVSLDEDHDAIALAFTRLNEVAPLTLSIGGARGWPSSRCRRWWCTVAATRSFLSERRSARTRDPLCAAARTRTGVTAIPDAAAVEVATAMLAL